MHFPSQEVVGRVYPGQQQLQSPLRQQPVRLECVTAGRSHRAHRLLGKVELTEEAGLSRGESMGGLRYKSVASQASLAWLHTLRKQLLFPKLSQCMEDVLVSLEKCHVLEKYLYH